MGWFNRLCARQLVRAQRICLHRIRLAEKHAAEYAARGWAQEAAQRRVKRNILERQFRDYARWIDEYVAQEQRERAQRKTEPRSE